MDDKQRRVIKVKEEGDNFIEDSNYGLKVSLSFEAGNQHQESGFSNVYHFSRRKKKNGYFLVELNLTRKINPLVINTVRVTSKININDFV